MIIVCDSCHQKYQANDNEVHSARVFKIRCKNCNTIIVVRKDTPSTTPPNSKPAIRVKIDPKSQPAQAIHPFVITARDQTFEFCQAEISIGSNDDNDIVLSGEKIAQHHGQIAVREGNFVIIDLENDDGTFLNNERITNPQVLNIATDQIRIGDTTITIAHATPLDTSDGAHKA